MSRRRGDTKVRTGFALPFAVLSVCLVVVTLYVHHLLASATAGDAVGKGSLPLYLAAGCFLLAAVSVVTMQCVRLAHRIAGPEYRLVQSLRRIRAGDVSFRIHLRRGDLLHGLAEECNALLDWLNRNPPAGARTGGDVYDIGLLDSDGVGAEIGAREFDESGHGQTEDGEVRESPARVAAQRDARAVAEARIEREVLDELTEVTKPDRVIELAELQELEELDDAADDRGAAEDEVVELRS